ncbi:M48 family metallopeptidase [Christensenella intestinihominis]|uniref:M48 family metallopeptidase n=1 Tax=Christensenella intestinihominis TaxID=1851429 RepID=UPI000A8BE9BB|nr:SprT family zinc-dependent metalloprotease [Christensenella intestinihominis]
MKIKLSDGSDLDIEVTRKAMKNIRLRVRHDGSVCVSAPFGVSSARIQEFVSSKSAWIENHINSLLRQQEADDDHVLFMGTNYALEVVKDRRTGVALNGENMTIFCGKPEEYKEVLQNWWVQQALASLGEIVNKWYPVLGQPEEDRPVIKIRKMKTLWGSCTSTQRTIRFNYYLMCASAECIEYVVLHELTHLLYPDHGADFKAFLSRHMPDWKERKRRLESQCAGMRMF